MACMPRVAYPCYIVVTFISKCSQPGSDLAPLCWSALRHFLMYHCKLPLDFIFIYIIWWAACHVLLYRQNSAGIRIGGSHETILVILGTPERLWWSMFRENSPGQSHLFDRTENTGHRKRLVPLVYHSLTWRKKERKQLVWKMCCVFKEYNHKWICWSL